MASGLITRFLGEGLAASRPADPDIGSAIGFYWSTDTNELSAWLENAWVENLLGSPTGAFALLGDISPSQITSDQDNYNPTNLSTASTLRLSSDASRNITGLQGGSDGRILFVHNVGSFNIVLKDESASSTAGNRFALTADVTLSPDSVAVLQYDSTSSRWRCVSGGGSGGSFTTASTTEVLTGTDTAKGATPDAIAALWEQGSDVASAATVSLGEGGYFNITGTTTIADIDFATDRAGRKAWVKFAGALTLTHNVSTLILPGGANITTAAGDTACFVSEGSDAVRCVAYQRASGLSVVTVEATPKIPLVADFAWNNQGVATAADGSGGIILDPGATTGNVRSLEQNAPSTPFDCYIRIAALSAAATNNQHGFWLRNSTNSRLIFLGYYHSSATTPVRAIIQRWTNNTTFSATVTDFGALTSPCQWLRVNVTSTTITFYVSNNGKDWNSLGTETIATFLTASGGGSLDKVGIGCNSSGRAILNIQSFSF